MPLRCDTDVLAALKTAGLGWQTRGNDIMRQWLKTHPAGECNALPVTSVRADQKIIQGRSLRLKRQKPAQALRVPTRMG